MKDETSDIQCPWIQYFRILYKNNNSTKNYIKVDNIMDIYAV